MGILFEPLNSLLDRFRCVPMEDETEFGGNILIDDEKPILEACFSKDSSFKIPGMAFHFSTCTARKEDKLCGVDSWDFCCCLLV